VNVCIIIFSKKLRDYLDDVVLESYGISKLWFYIGQSHTKCGLEKKKEIVSAISKSSKGL
jgi:hypothetical protein